MISAFGVDHGISKSEYDEGKYQSISEMKPKRRQKVADLATDRKLGIVGNRNRKPTSAQHGGRSTNDLYSRHGAQYISREHGGVHALAKVPTVKSRVHRNIEYSQHTTPELRSRMDRMIDPKVAGTLKRPVVVHHVTGPKGSGRGAVAAAVKPHVTTGHKGHVVINDQAIDRYGVPRRDFGGGPGGHRVINHELAHTNVYGRNPAANTQHSSIGEEARADAHTGVPNYRRNGHFSSRKQARAVLAKPMSMRAAKWHPKDTRGRLARMHTETATRSLRYGDVYSAVKTALKARR